MQLEELTKENTRLQAEVERLAVITRGQRTTIDTIQLRVESLQSELTQARELLADVRKLKALESQPISIDIDAFLSNQSAPADKVPALIQALHANGDLIAMEATIAQQAQRIADLEAWKGQGEPVDAPFPSEDELIASGLGYPFSKEEAVHLYYSGFKTEPITVLEAWDAIGHDIGCNPGKDELLDSLRNMAAICDAHGNDMPAKQPAPAAAAMPEDWQGHLLDEMDTRFELNKHDDCYLPNDDTQVGVEFAIKWVAARLNPIKQ